jgi:hypothetical protein
MLNALFCKWELHCPTIFGALYEITKIPLVRDLSHGHLLKYFIEFYFYNVRYLNHEWYFLKFLIFPTSVT